MKTINQLQRAHQAKHETKVQWSVKNLTTLKVLTCSECKHQIIKPLSQPNHDQKELVLEQMKSGATMFKLVSVINKGYRL